jgi:hypothetical protein
MLWWRYWYWFPKRICAFYLNESTVRAWQYRPECRFVWGIKHNLSIRVETKSRNLSEKWWHYLTSKADECFPYLRVKLISLTLKQYIKQLVCCDEMSGLKNYIINGKLGILAVTVYTSTNFLTSKYLSWLLNLPKQIAFKNYFKLLY